MRQERRRLEQLKSRRHSGKCIYRRKGGLKFPASACRLDEGDGEKGAVCPHQSMSALPDLVAAIAAIVGALTSAGVLIWGYRYTKLANKEMLELKASIDERHELIRTGLRRIEENDVLVHRKLHKAIDASRLASRWTGQPFVDIRLP